MIFTIIGIASAIIFIFGDIPYFRDTLTGKTRPHRVTWGVVSFMNTIGFANQYASGARNSLWLFGAGAIVTGAIFLASFKHGSGGINRSDIFCLVASLIGIGLWISLKSPVYSILASAFVDIVALLPTYKKTKRHPETETRISWLIGTISSLLAAISVGTLDWQLLLLPVLAVILQSYMVYILYFMSRPAPAR